MIGGDSLYELRGSLQLAEQERRGGVVGGRVSPMVGVGDVGGLLRGAGFGLATVDVEEIVVEFPDLGGLVADLNAMGEGNAGLIGGNVGLGREVLAGAEGVYRELYGYRREGDGIRGEGDGEWVLPATFRVIFMIGWTPGEGQQKPLQRGSGQVSMKDVLGGGDFGGGSGGKR